MENSYPNKFELKLNPISSVDKLETANYQSWPISNSTN